MACMDRVGASAVGSPSAPITYHDRMRCEVLFFAQAREAAGSDRQSIDLPDRATVRTVLDALSAQHPHLQMLRGRLAVAIDQRYASADTPLREGCVIALIPPVSGG